MYNMNYALTTLGHKVEKKMYLGVRERKRWIIIGLLHRSIHSIRDTPLSTSQRSCIAPVPCAAKW